MTPPASTEPMYLNITEGELDRLEQLGTVECGDTEARDIGEVVRARGPVVQQAPTDDPLKLWKDTRMLADIESLTCSKCDEEQKDRCNQGHHCLRSHELLAEHDAALIAQEREKWKRERAPAPIGDCHYCDRCIEAERKQTREDVLKEVSSHLQKRTFFNGVTWCVSNTDIDTMFESLRSEVGK